MRANGLDVPRLCSVAGSCRRRGLTRGGPTGLFRLRAVLEGIHGGACETLWGLWRFLRSVIVLFGFNGRVQCLRAWGSRGVSMGGIVLVKGIKGSPRIECLSANVTMTDFPLTAASHTCALSGNARIPRQAR